jgi:ADP-heptose:LPS heptosyltransferase
LRALKTNGRASCVDLLLGSRTRAVFEKNPHVDRIHTLDLDRLRGQGKWKSFAEVVDLLLLLKSRKYDVLIDCSLSRRFAFFGRFTLGIPEIIGFDYKKRGTFLTRKVALPEGYRNKHASEYHADLVRLAGIAVDTLKPDFYYDEMDEIQAGECLAAVGMPEGCSYLAVSPGGGESWGRDADFKRWLPENFAEAINALAKEMPFDAVVILGTDGERPLAERLKEKLAKPAYDLSGRISIRAAGAVLKNSIFFLGNDSGLVHVARALEVPLVALYGPVDEKIYGPYPPGPLYLPLGRNNLACRPCYRNFRYNAACVHRECLTCFYPDEVVARIVESGFLESAGERR